MPQKPKIWAWFTRLSGSKKGERYRRYFRTEKQMHAKMKYYEKRYRTDGLSPAPRTEKGLIAAQRGIETKSRKEVERAVKVRQGMAIHTNLIKSIDRTASETKLRALAQTMKNKGYKIEAQMAIAKADKIAKKTTKIKTKEALSGTEKIFRDLMKKKFK